MTDERKNLPSASGIEQLTLCPGSWRAQQNIPTHESAESPDAASGTRIHAHLAGDDVTLTDDEHECAIVCEEKLLDVRHRLGFRRDALNIRERRLWLTAPDGTRLASGRPDVLIVEGGRALVVDYKTGRNGATDAVDNLQLRTLAVIVSQLELIGVTEVTAAIIQPRCSPQVTTHVYADDALWIAHDELLATLERIKSPDAPRIAGEKQCRFCRAKASCPEAQASMKAVAVVPTSDVPALTPQRVADLLDACGRAEAVIDAVRAEAKRLLESGATVPGWTLKPGAIRETITDPAAVFERFIACGGTPNQFMPAVALKRAELKTALKVVTGAKGEALDVALGGLLAGAVETKQIAPSLTRVKP